MSLDSPVRALSSHTRSLYLICEREREHEHERERKKEKETHEDAIGWDDSSLGEDVQVADHKIPDVDANLLAISNNTCNSVFILTQSEHANQGSNKRSGKNKIKNNFHTPAWLEVP